MSDHCDSVPSVVEESAPAEEVVEAAPAPAEEVVEVAPAPAEEVVEVAPSS